MYVQERKNGTFVCRQEYSDLMTGTRKTVSCTIKKNNYRSRQLAQQKLDQMIYERNHPIVQERITFSQLLDLYWKDCEKELKESTIRRNKFAMKFFSDRIPPDADISKFNAAYIRKILSESDKNNVTLNEYLKRFKILFNWAYRNDLVANVQWMQKLAPYKTQPRRESIKDKFLERPELEALLNVMRLKQYMYLTEFLALSGLRIGEAIALEMDDVDFDNRLIYVTKTYDPNNKIITMPKTMDSVRDVYLQDELFKVAKQARQCTQETYLMIGQKDKYFFCSPSGYQVRYDSYRQYLSDQAKKAIPEKKVTPHILRHTHCSLLAEAGVPLATISRRLGHHDSRITQEVYLHTTKKMEENDRMILQKISIL